jgi:lipopolysaccharide/colanic/teichoic acid biosynthesis glycosyltransferase
MISTPSDTLMRDMRQREAARSPTADHASTFGEDARPEARPRAALTTRDLVRYAANLSLAALALITVAPIMFVIAALIKLTSRGPVLYTQTRVGLDRRRESPWGVNHRRALDMGGKPFTIYKFRTMYTNAEAGTGPVWATKDDPRITPVGRFLRQYRLDELPQLVNVIRGEMNLVGPRPERPAIFAELRQNISEYALRQRAKPGITGLAQINQHYDESLEDVRRKVEFDLQYIRRQGLLEDLKIMLKTIPVVLLRRGGW